MPFCIIILTAFVVFCWDMAQQRQCHFARENGYRSPQRACHIAFGHRHDNGDEGRVRVPFATLQTLFGREADANLRGYSL